MSSPPLVSILIPSYNAERYIKQAVEAALAQTYPAIEIVCVDDGSTDGTVTRLREFGDRIHLEVGPNRGACAARNRALELSRGAFVQFLDADDFAHPAKIERQLPPLVAGEADLVLCNQQVLEPGGIVRIEASAPSPEGMDPFVYCLGIATPGVKGHASTQLALHRRSCLEAIGGFRVGLRKSQDKDLALRLAASGVRFHYLDEVLLTYRQHGGPRISAQPKAAGYSVTALLEIADILLSGLPYRMTMERHRVLASKLVQEAIKAYKRDASGAAAAGFRRALEIDPALLRESRSGYEIVAKTIGLLNTERLLRYGVPSKRARRRVRRWLERSSGKAGRRLSNGERIEGA